MFQFFYINASKNLLIRQCAAWTSFLFCNFSYFLPFLPNNSLAYYCYYYLQTRNQEFSGQGIFLGIKALRSTFHQQHKKERPCRKKMSGFSSWKLKPKMATIKPPLVTCLIWRVINYSHIYCPFTKTCCRNIWKCTFKIIIVLSVTFLVRVHFLK